MTIKELYEQAVLQGCENYEMVIDQKINNYFECFSLKPYFISNTTESVVFKVE